ncbi:N-acyl homoserine lactonase [Rhodobacteraceae bacterium THAF1]|uniref:MBL fold metallo-hydrolase n=1 Tax=Palleronia sp. THAF1 TaxID=2587842 RepID=UPI000F4036E5|nr:MBL fold metallo-hydrolase [Palleronia sp. THAF1]QFU09520.1 N-acyl homoserine lactonase [Palleronia sp. THAF1]VDC21799.1 N-acyl homoserine lactonase [Rhodobacteraceae bacterium THAF1]
MTNLPDAQRIHVGDIRITCLSDGPLPLGVEQLTGVDEPEYARLLRLHHHDPETWRSGLNAFVIETGDRKILVDAGVAGNMGDHTGRVPANLKAAGFAPEDIDTVFVTHLHPDHIAGLMDGGTARFSNATLRVHQADKDHFTDDDLAQSVLKAYEHETFAGETEIAPGLRALPLPGHTPGHSGLEIMDGSKTLLMWTDIVHIHPVQLANPSIGTGFDVDGEQAAQTRRQMLDRVTADDIPILGSHITFPGAGYIEKATEGYRLAPMAYTHDV